MELILGDSSGMAESGQADTKRQQELTYILNEAPETGPADPSPHTIAPSSQQYSGASGHRSHSEDEERNNNQSSERPRRVDTEMGYTEHGCQTSEIGAVDSVHLQKRHTYPLADNEIRDP